MLTFQVGLGWGWVVVFLSRLPGRLEGRKAQRWERRKVARACEKESWELPWKLAKLGT